MRFSVLRVASATAAITLLGATPAFATTAPTATSGGATNSAVTATVNVATVSVTVSPTLITMNGCTWQGIDTHGQLATPNGVCGGQAAANVITVTNGDAPATIEVTGSRWVPSDGGTAWTLCGDRGPACTGANSLPGTDQVHESDSATPGTGSTPGEVGTLTDTPQCDVTFTQAGTTSNPCAANPGQAVNEEQTIQGPSSSTDPSTQFTSTITWTAVAQ